MQSNYNINWIHRIDKCLQKRMIDIRYYVIIDVKSGLLQQAKCQFVNLYIIL